MEKKNGLTCKQHLQQRKGEMWNERSSWIGRYQQITDVLLPYSGRYFAGDRNRGDRLFNKIYDETATFALDTLAAGMMAGMTSPARPWFQLATPDKALMEYEPVKRWLYSVTELMRDIFAKSNTYNALHSMYEELGAFATAASIIEDDFDTVIHHTSLTAGEYAIATNDKGRVDTLAREFDMTVKQIVEKFVFNNDPKSTPDWSRVSISVKNAWDTGRGLDSWRTVSHIIQPRMDRDTRKLDAKNMRFGSYYFENGNDSNSEMMLRESGYKRFNVLAPRWSVRGGDIYGNGPSFRALGSIKQLQQEQFRKGQAIDYQTKPPLQAPAELKNKGTNMLPGGVSYISNQQQGSVGISTAFEVNLDLGHLLADIVDVRERINRSFYADLFLMISQDARKERATAAEIAERHEEKLLMIGPTLERLHNELLSPKIDMTFGRILDAGLVPEPPKELQGMELKVEFISTLAQAQKMVGLGSLDRLLGTIAQLSTGSQDPGVWDKIDKDEVVDRYADMLGTDPAIIVGDDRVAELREQRAKAQQAAAAAEAVPAAAGAAKDLAAADTSGKNALTDVLSRLQGYNVSV